MKNSSIDEKSDSMSIDYSVNSFEDSAGETREDVSNLERTSIQSLCKCEDGDYSSTRNKHIDMRELREWEKSIIDSLGDEKSEIGQEIKEGALMLLRMRYSDEKLYDSSAPTSV